MTLLPHPIDGEVVDDEDDAADGPGHRIGRENDADVVVESKAHLDEDDAEDAPDGEHDEHRDDRFTRPTVEAGHGVAEGEGEEEERAGPRFLHPIENDLRVAAEEGDERGGAEVHHQPNGFGHEHGEDDAEAGALAHPLILPGSEVLAGEGGQGEGEGGDGDEGEALSINVI